MEYCIICFDPLDAEKAHHVVCVECNIDLHDECFQIWQQVDTTCPHCRMELLTAPAPILAPASGHTQEPAPLLAPVPVSVQPANLAIIVPPPITFNLPHVLDSSRRNARVSPSQEEVRVIDFSAPPIHAPIHAPALRSARENPRCYYIGNYLIIFFLSAITLLQEYMVWSLKLDFEFFIIFLVTNGLLIFFGAKMVSVIPLISISPSSLSPTSLESWIKYPLFSMVLVYTILLSGGGAINVFTFLLAWIFNMNIWNFIYLMTILVFKIRSSCFF